MSLTLSACSSSKSSAGGEACGDSKSPIQIFNILPLTGPQANAGNAQKSADQVAVDVFNKHQKICGRSVSLQNLDDKGDPATALNYARQLVADKHDLVFNDSFGEAEDAIHPYLMKNHVVTFSNIAVVHSIGQPANPTAFSPGPGTPSYAQTMIKYAAAHDPKNLGIIADGTTFSNEMVKYLKQSASASGLTIKDVVTYSPTADDLSTPLSELRQSGVQTLAIAGDTALNSMASSLKQIGWNPDVVGWGGFNAYGVAKAQLPPNTVDFCYTPYSKALLTPLNTELLTAQEKVTGLNSGVQNVLMPYASLLVLQKVIEQTKSLDGASVAAGIEKLTNFATNMPSVNLTFTPSNHFGFPASALTMCAMTPEVFDLLKPAS